MPSILSYLNRLLPFATPGTPLIQDLLHLVAICGTLYFAPQIQDWYQRRQALGVPELNEQGHENEQFEPRVNDGEDVAAGDVMHEIHGDANELHGGPDDNVDDQDQGHEVNGHAHGNWEDEAAQADPARIPDMPAARSVGTKKAKALAKKDQRRAYHEFQRSQGEAQRAKDAEGAAEREAELAAERERRRATESALEAKKAKERERKREQERKAREEDVRTRQLVVRIVREELEDRRVCDLMKVARRVGQDVDVEWVEKIVTASGILGSRSGVVTMITGMGWVVRVNEEDMAVVYRKALEDGMADSDEHVSFDALGSMLEEVLRKT